MNNEKELRHRYGWTPAPTKPAYSQTNVNLEYKGRDIESLMRYHEAHLKGRTDDDCLAEKFGSGESGKNVSGDTPRAATMPTGACRPPVCPAPTPPPQQSADGPWPKWAIATTGGIERLWRINGTKKDCEGYLRYAGVCYEPDIRAPRESTFVIESFLASEWRSESEAAQWLEQNGHAEVAAQLRGKGAADDLYEPVGTMPVVGDVMRRNQNGREYPCVGIYEEGDRKFGSTGISKAWMNFRSFATGEYRILKRKPAAQAVAARAWKHDDGHALYVEAPSGCYYYSMIDSWKAFSWPKAKESTLWSETFGPERDAIVAECCAAMKLDPKTGEPINK